MSLQIVNVFLRAKLDRKFDLNDKKVLACGIWNAEFNPRRKSNVTIRFKRPPVTVDVSTNGFLAILGAENEQVARKVALKAAAKIKKLFDDVYIKWFRIENVVGRVDVGFEIQLLALAKAHREATAYEPELSPDLQYKLGEGFVAKIHKSGKITLMGGKSVAGAFRAWEELQPVVSQFKAAPSAPPPQPVPAAAYATPAASYAAPASYYAAPAAAYAAQGQHGGSQNKGTRPVYAGQPQARTIVPGSAYPAQQLNAAPLRMGQQAGANQASEGLLQEDFMIDFPADFPMP